MKRKLISLIVALMFSVGNLFAWGGGLTPYSVDVTTYPITEVVTMEAQIPYDAKIGQIILSSDDVLQNQEVTFYKLGASTTTVTKVFSVYFSSGTGAIDNPIVLDYRDSNLLMIDDLCIRKSSTTCNVQATIMYR